MTKCTTCNLAAALGMYLRVCLDIKELDCKDIEEKVLKGEMKPEEAFAIIKSKASKEDKEILDAIDEEVRKSGN